MNEKNKKIFNAYLKDEKLRGHRPRGFAGLKQRVPRVIEFAQETGIELTAFTFHHALGFQKSLIDYKMEDGTSYAPASILNYLSCAWNFFEYLKLNKMVPVNPFSQIRKIRREMKLPRDILKEGEINHLLQKLSRYDEEKGLKNKITRYKMHVLAELLYATGLRIAEAADVTLDDVDLYRGTIEVKEGKGGKNRIVYLAEQTKELLHLYIRDMRPLILTEHHTGSDRLFGPGFNNLGKHLNRYLKKICTELEIPVITSHSFRHCLGFHLLRSGCDIRYIQALLGHDHLKTTEIYTKVDKKDLRSILDKCHPRQFNRRTPHAYTG